jgi:hypothetical protein
MKRAVKDKSDPDMLEEYDFSKGVRGKYAERYIERALTEEFKELKERHREALKRTAARVILGPSVMRVYEEGTRKALLPLLPKLDVDTLVRLRDQEQYSEWFDAQVARVAQAIDRHNPHNSRIRPGFKWGHATKITAIFIRDLVLSSRYFSDSEAERISFFLYVPIDSVVIRRLKLLGVRLPFRKIKEVDTREKFYLVQNTLEKAATEVGVPRVWFDDNWAIRS